MKRNLSMGASLATAFVLFLAVNLIAGIVLKNFKIDLTEERLYTLSEGSKRMLSKIEGEVKLRLFYSRRAASSIAPVKQYADRVIELLAQFEAAAGGSVTLEVIEPRPDTEAEETALKYGMRALPVLADENLYFGLAITSELGQEQAIPFLDPSREGYLEYDISRLIASVASSEKKTIGIMSALNVMGGYGSDPRAQFSGQPPAQPWVIVNELRQSFDVEKVEMTVDDIDRSIDLLLVIHPRGITEKAEYAIDQYLLRGGKAIVMVDPHSEYEHANFQSPNPQDRFSASFDSSLTKLFENWGIEMSAGKVIGDRDLGTLVRAQTGEHKYIVWMGLDDSNCNQEEIISAGLENMIFASAGGLRKSEDPSYEIVALIESTASAMEVDAFMLKFGPNPEQLLKNYAPGGRKLAMAYKITGKFETAFPAGAPGGDSTSEHLAEAEDETTVIVISDVDFISDRFSVRKQNLLGRQIAFLINDNQSFLNNAIENMMGSQDLISLRTRGRSVRPFTRVDEIEAEAQGKYRSVLEALELELEETNKKLRALESGKDETQRNVLSASQMAEIKKFREQQAETTRKRREVRRDLRQDIESLGLRLKFINIALMPLLVIIASFVAPLWRSRKMRTSQ